ncbi:MAG: chemotaxis protein CheB [Planctomycetota bacterium]
MSRATDNRSSNCLYIVGVGASAGGFEPIERFFGALKADTGSAFVVVQHLSPDFKSLMRELLERHTRMKVLQVEDGMRCEPDCVYLIPPKKNMVLRGGCLRLFDQDLKGNRALQYPIDQFLESLAAEMRERSIAVILSGAGSDGARGVRAVNEAGGLVMVQSVDTAQFDGMPRSALASGSAHSALPPDEIARAIYNYVKRLDLDTPEGPVVHGTQDPNVLQEVVALLRSDSTIDFSHYRGGTISRRISRRISITGLRGVNEYLVRLAEDPHEREALRSDLLIGVTGFFRDAPAWQVLREQVLEPLVRDATDRPIRCWVTACSTGEEVYSLALLLHECAERLGGDADIKIFATDIDKRALETAAAGVYPPSIREEVDLERLQRWFVPDGKNFRVARKLRECVIFAEHNLNRDAPFTNMDLVSCRNALIYMEAGLQHRVLAMLHFALRVGGTLFLGAAESCGDLTPEFQTIDGRWKLFGKRRNVVLRQEGRRPALSIVAPITPRPQRPVARQPADTPTRDNLLTQAFRALLHQRNAASFLVSDKNELLHVFGRSESYTRVPEGASTQDITRMLVPELSLPLGTALQKARQTNATTRYTDIGLPGGRTVDLTVTPVSGEGGVGLDLVFVEDATQVQRSESTPFTIDDHVAGRIHALEEELQQSRETLQATIEELETTNEEHQATNEELMASNEELQSTNEELQSVNEELYTVNAEHQDKIQELTRLNSDVENLLRNTPMATLFLDQDLVIRRMTASIHDLINIAEGDIGRPAEHFSHRLVGFDLWREVRKVAQSGSPLERLVASARGRQYLMRVQPYELEGRRHSGLVVTFLDTRPLQQLLAATSEPGAPRPPKRRPRKRTRTRDGDGDGTQPSAG